VKVRYATADDTDAIMALVREMHAEAPTHRARRMCEVKAADYLNDLREEATVLVVEDSGGTIAGLAAMIVGENAWLEGVDAKEVLLYVAQERRGSSAAMRLVDAMELVAERRGAKRLVVGDSTGNRVAQSIYRRLGYEVAGVQLIKTLTSTM